MATFPGLYRAKAVKIEAASLTAQIPQVYGEATVTVTDFVGGMPTSVGMGWVTFRSGDPAFPVWHGESGNGNGNGHGGTGVTDGDKGDIIVSGTGTSWLLDPEVVTPAAKTVLDDTSTAAMRTTLGLGNVDNTSDASKPISGATNTALNAKADKTTAISTTAPLTGGGDISANRTLAVSTFNAASSGVVTPSGGGTVNFLRADGQWALPPGAGGGISGITVKEDSTTLGSAFTSLVFGNALVATNVGAEATVVLDLGTYTGAGLLPNAKVAGLGTLALKSTIVSADITDGTISNADLATMPANTLKMNNTAGVAAPTDVTVASLLTALGLSVPVTVVQGGTGRATSTTAYGLIAAGTTATGAQQTIPPGTTGQFLKSAGAAALAAFAGITNLDVSGLGSLATKSSITTTDILDNSVTLAKLADMATQTIRGRNTAGTGDPEDLAPATVKTMLALVKADVGLGNVDNTSDATKNSASATLTNKSIDLLNNTVTGTSAQFNIANIDADFYTTGGTDVAVVDGGTGRSTSTTPNGVIAAGTTATGPFQTILPGATGQFLKSAGSAVPGTFASIVEADVTNLVTDLSALTNGKVDKTITISTTAPLAGGGDLSANRSLTVAAATTAVVGVSRLSTVAEAVALSPLATIGVTPASLVAGYLQLTGGTVTGNLNITGNGVQLAFGSRQGQHILLSSTTLGVGVQGVGGAGQDTVYFRAPTAFYWYQGGAHDNFSGVAGAGGIPLMSLDAANLYYKTSKVWHKGNQGHTVDSSGINADMLDTYHASYFANQEEVENLLGDLLYVGTYDAGAFDKTTVTTRATTKPHPDWSGGASVYRNGMYWVVNNPGDVDFIIDDASGRYPTADPIPGTTNQLHVVNGDWIIASVLDYVVTNKALTTNVATLTVALPVTTPPTTQHSFLIGTTLVVAGVDAVFDGTYTVTAVTATTVSYAKVNANVTSVVATGTLSGEIFQYIPFSAENYVKSVMLAHLAAADPHPQYFLEEYDANGQVVKYAPLVHNHQAEIRQQVINHQIQDSWSVYGWSWNPNGVVTLTVDPRHSILATSYINLKNVDPALNKKWKVLDAETDPTLISFTYSTTAPPGYTVPVTLPGAGGQIFNDPHSQYLDQDEADALYLTELRADELYADIVHNHDTLYEKLGAVALHVATKNPHPEYLTPEEGDIAYAKEGHTHPEILEVHATDTGASADIWIGDKQPTVANGVAVGDLWVETNPIALQPPTAKVLTAANASTGYAVVLTWPAWTAAEALTGISLERSTDGTTWPTVLTTTVSLTTWTDSGLTANTPYWYRIKGINASGQGSPAGSGPYSTAVSIVTKPADVTGVNASSSSATDAHVAWTAPASGTGYQYEVYVNGVLKTTQAGVTYTAAAVTENTPVTFGIRSKGSSGLFGTTVSDSTTSLNADPVQPASLTMSSVDSDSAVGTWVASTSPDRKDYEVFLGSTSKGFTTALSYTFTGLAASTPYTFGVRTRDTGLLYSPQRTASATTAAPPDTTPPPAPTIQRFAPDVSYGRMTIDFTLGTGTAAYRIDRSTDGATWATIVNWTAGSGAKTDILVGTYSSGTIYCRVYARDTALNSTYTNAPAYTLIASPTYITASSTNHYRANGTWNAMGTSRPIQGYYSNTAYNATGCWFYGTKPNSTLYYGGRRTITSGKIWLKRMDGGDGVNRDITLWKHQYASVPAGAPALFVGTDIDANLPWNGAAVSVALPADWANQIVANTAGYRGFAVFKSTADGTTNYMTLANLSEDANTGRLEIAHLG